MSTTPGYNPHPMLYCARLRSFHSHIQASRLLGTLRINRWDPIIERMRKKLASWKSNMLSIGGRTTLLKASLASLPLYYLSCFPVPKGIIDKINKFQRQFFWCGTPGDRSLHLVPWNIIEYPKALGGLSIGNLHQRNTALLFKWLW